MTPADPPSPTTDTKQTELQPPSLGSFFFLLAACTGAFFLGRGPLPKPLPEPEAQLAGKEHLRGRELARTLCASCHLEPAPEIATRTRWAFEILPEKAILLGIESINTAEQAEGDEVITSGAPPDKPVISQENWNAICNFYLTAAPDDHPKISSPSSELTPATTFRPVALNHPDATRMSAVRIDPTAGVIYLGNADTPALEVVSSAGKVLAAIPIGQPILAIKVQAKGLWLATGSTDRRSDVRSGEIVFLGKPGTSGPRQRTVMKDLVRPVDLEIADLNQDERPDLLVCEAGGYRAGLAWFANDGRTYIPHDLSDDTGAIATDVGDFDGDQRLDIVQLLAGGQQKILMYRNEGGGHFTRKIIRQRHPAWNFTDVIAADINGDGKLDIITSNGDDERMSSQAEPEVPYHGIRIHLATADGGFTESFFHHLNRARRVAARDFDGDGDIDLVGIGYSTHHRHATRNGAVYLENQGNMHFEAFALPHAGDGRWYDMDIGDVDQDGDPDIVLAALHPGAGKAPEALLTKWSDSPMTCLILINQVIP